MQYERVKECVYCGATNNLTAEHVPPKLVFPRPRPSNLITVRACQKCNHDGSQDAEYFRLWLCMYPLSKDTPSARAVVPTARRSLNRAQARGFRAQFFQAMEPEYGMIAVTVEMGRIHKVIRRVIQCLYMHETGRRLLDTHQPSVASIEVVSRLEPKKKAAFSRLFLERLAQQEWRSVADGQFAYSVIHTDRPFVSVWGLSFYGTLPFVALTGRNGRGSGEYRPIDGAERKSDSD